MSFGERLKEARILKGLTQKQLAEKLNIGSTTVTGYEKNNSEPNMLTISKIMDILEIDANFLFQDEKKELYKNEASPEEFENIIKRYRLISEHSPNGKIVIDTVLNREYSIAEMLKKQSEQIQNINMEIAKKFTSKRVLAYYGKIAAAGKSYGFDDVTAGTIECPLTNESERADYAIGVSGNSMEPTFYDSDIVYVKKNAMPEIGDIGIFQKDNCIYIKEVGENQLISHNPEYKPIVNNGDILCLGKVIGKIEED